jgi:DNA-directed RNA polymerase specialized sigma24 family protein
MSAAHHYFVAIQPPPLPCIIPTLWASAETNTPTYEDKYKIKIIDNSLTGTRLWIWRVQDEDRTEQSRKQVNLAHKMFLVGQMTLEDYTAEAIKYLHGGGHSGGYGPDYDAALEDVHRFIIEIVNSLDDKTFHPGPYLSAKLEREYRKYKEAQNCRWTKEWHREFTQSLRDAPESSWRGEKNLESLKRGDTKARLEQAYAKYVDPQARREYGNTEENGKAFLKSRLITLVFAFAWSKIEGDIWGLPNAYKDADDFAQDVSMKVMNGLEKFVGGPANFYSWLHRICYTTGVDARREIEEAYADVVPFLVETEFEDGSMGEQEHPDVIRQFIIDDEPHHPVAAYVPPLNLKTTDAESLPHWLKGQDRTIAEGIKAGKTHLRIAEELGLKRDAVKQRAHRLTKKLGKWSKSREAKLNQQAKTDVEANLFTESEE